MDIDCLTCPSLSGTHRGKPGTANFNFRQGTPHLTPRPLSASRDSYLAGNRWRNSSTKDTQCFAYTP